MLAFDREFLNRIRCTPVEIKELCTSIRILISFAEKAKKGGLFVIEAELENVDLGNLHLNRFFKKCFELVFDGIDAKNTYFILRNRILLNAYSGKELLHRILIAEGALGIQAGNSPRLIREKLISYLPDSFWDSQESISCSELL
ncbi:MAG: hypothetical protein H7A25_17155 [Leptospiraceae bacterium]|nr:hypothetical protein [Leptospiraceae bacterium]